MVVANMYTMADVGNLPNIPDQIKETRLKDN